MRSPRRWPDDRNPWTRSVLRGALGLGLLIGSMGPSRAAEATAWQPGRDSAARLLEGAAPRDGSLLAGIEVHLSPHFVTYWRDPGDAGVPPTFDVAGSANVKAVHVLYPAPDSLDEAGAQVFGYQGDVVFPILVQPMDPTKPVTLKVAFAYAVCHEICIPAKADLDLVLDGNPSADAALIARALKAVPRLSQVGQGGPSPRILSVGPQPGQEGDLVVEAVAPPGGGTLFVEAPEGWAYASTAAGAGPRLSSGEQRLSFAVKRLAAPTTQVTPAVPLTLTLVTPSGAIEVPVDLGRAAAP